MLQKGFKLRKYYIFNTFEYYFTKQVLCIVK